jgi:hypothetical protein
MFFTAFSLAENTTQTEIRCPGQAFSGRVISGKAAQVRSAPTGRSGLAGMLSQDCAALYPGLFSAPPSEFVTFLFSCKICFRKQMTYTPNKRDNSKNSQALREEMQQ